MARMNSWRQLPHRAVTAKVLDESFKHNHHLSVFEHCLTGAPIAQWVKQWPADLMVPSSIPTAENLFKCKVNFLEFFNGKQGSISSI